MPAERTVPVGMRARPSAKRTVVAVENKPRAIRKASVRPMKPRMDDAERHAMQDLFSLEARRRQELHEQDRLAHETRTQKSLDIDQSIRTERLKSQENRAPEPSWPEIFDVFEQGLELGKTGEGGAIQSNSVIKSTYVGREHAYMNSLTAFPYELGKPVSRESKEQPSPP